MLPVLTGDCTRCVGLCCVALPFAKSADFPVDKAAGRTCTHLQADFRCGIHERLLGEGYRGCTSYDCFGAGQRVTAQFAGTDWRGDPVSAQAMFDAFGVTRQLHEMLVHLDSAAAVVDDRTLHAELLAARERVDALAGSDPVALAAVDVPNVRDGIGELLTKASKYVRGGAPVVDPRIRRGADLAGADLRAVELRDADLRGAILIRADLRGADLCRTDLLGADLRDADLRGADLSQALFVTTPQLASARGDTVTRIASGLVRPLHWLG